MAGSNPAAVGVVSFRDGIWYVCAPSTEPRRCSCLWGRAAIKYLYISSAVPNKRSLGAANGLAQVATSIQSAVGPAAADWLFAFSLTHNVLGGNFAYVVLVGVSCIALGVSTRLPRNTWARHKE